MLVSAIIYLHGKSSYRKELGKGKPMNEKINGLRTKGGRIIP